LLLFLRPCLGQYPLTTPRWSFLIGLASGYRAALTSAHSLLPTSGDSGSHAGPVTGLVVSDGIGHPSSTDSVLDKCTEWTTPCDPRRNLVPGDAIKSLEYCLVSWTYNHVVNPLVLEGTSKNRNQGTQDSERDFVSFPSRRSC